MDQRFTIETPETSTDIINQLCLSPSSSSEWSNVLSFMEPEELRRMVDSAKEFQLRRDHFTAILFEKGLSTVKVDGDGNCLFRAISFAIYGTDEHFGLLRQYACAYVRKYPSKCFRKIRSPDGSEGIDWSSVTCYADKMSCDKEWGDEVVIRAMSLLYERPVKVWITDGGDGISLHPDFNGSSDKLDEWSNDILLCNFSGVSHFDALYASGCEVYRLSTPVGRYEEAKLNWI